MRVVATEAVLKKHPNLDLWLWEIACHSKENDPDIKLMGLHVQVRRSRRSDYWSGQAWPDEETWSYRTRPATRIIHPAGRITMSIGDNCSRTEVARLFAHELRHIGQFHRGRQQYARLTTKAMPEELVEPDCYEFEDLVLESLRNGLPKGKGSLYHNAAIFASA